MREITIRSGNYVGTHIVYDSVKEAEQNGIKPIKPWYNADTGDWVVADDGYVIQLLKRSKITNKFNQHTHIYRFPNKMVGIYERKNGTFSKIPSYHAQHMTSTKTKIAPADGIVGQYLTKKEKRFALLVKEGWNEGMTLEQAYRLAYKDNSSYVEHKIERLLNKPGLIKMMIDKEHILGQVQNKMGVTIEDWLIDKLTELLQKEKLSVKELRNNIKFLLEILSEKGKANNIMDADYEELPAPTPKILPEQTLTDKE